MYRSSTHFHAALRAIILLSILAATLAGRAGASPGDWKQVGNPGDWKNTAAGATVDNTLYSVETSGQLYATDLLTGAWRKLGQGGIPAVRMLFSNNGLLYCIHTNGDFSWIDPDTGLNLPLGERADWRDTRAGAVLDTTLYTTEANGNLIATDLLNGERRTIRKADFANTAHLFASDDSLLSIEEDGTLYRIDPNDGSWKQVGKSETWKHMQGGAMIGGRLYTVGQKTGSLYITNPDDGTWLKAGERDFVNTDLVFATGDTLYTIEKDGSLYAVEAEPQEEPQAE